MTDERWSDFYNKMVKAGVVKAGIDYKKAYTLQFVNKGVGLDSAAEELIWSAEGGDASAPPSRHFCDAGRAL